MPDINATTGASVDVIGTATDQAQIIGMTTGTTAISQQPTRAYTESDYQRMATSQYAAGLLAAMKEAGFEPEKGEDFKKQMAAFRQWQESQKSEAELALDAKKKAEDGFAAKAAENDALRAQIEALKLGVRADALADVIALAERQGAYADDKAAAIKAVIGKYPLFAEQAKPTGSGITSPQNPAAPQAGTAFEDFTKMTYNEKLALKESHPALYEAHMNKLKRR